MKQFLGMYVWQNEDKTETAYIDAHYNCDVGVFEFIALKYDTKLKVNPRKFIHDCQHSHSFFELYPGSKRLTDPININLQSNPQKER